MLEARGRQIVISPFEDNSKPMFYDRGDDIDVVLDTSGGKVKSIVETSEEGFTLRTKADGIIPNNSILSLPEKHHTLPVLRDSDIEDIEKINKMHKIDFLAIPYVSSKEDILEVKRRLPIPESQIVILARIDDRKGIEDFWEIANLSGGIILNRTNLSTAFTADKLFCL